MRVLLISFLLQASMMAMALQAVPLSQDAMLKIGVKIWHNESGGRDESLLSWNHGEAFASLGLGHFLWYPKQSSPVHGQSFVDLIGFLSDQGVLLPRWLRPDVIKYCPWSDREAFYRDHGPKKRALMTLMRETIPLQIQFILNRFEKALPGLIKTIDHAQRPLVQARLEGLLQTEKGVYILVDYLNFKGEGLSQNPDGWGLLQVLQQMAHAPSNLQDIEAFVWAADVLLAHRAEENPTEKKWLPGWRKRLYSYLD